MTVGIVGYGRFGKLAARYLSRTVEVVVFDRRPVRIPVAQRHVRRAPLAEVAACPVVILAVPIGNLRHVLAEVASHLRPSSLVVDVCSVKVQPARWMRSTLPPDTFILGAHPLFGPDSAKDSLAGQRIVLCPVRIPPPLLRKIRTVLQVAGLRVKVMRPDRHDREMADSLFLTQFIGHLVGDARFARRAFSTNSYADLMKLVQIADNDTRELFRDMYSYNPYARATIRTLRHALQRLLNELR